MIAALYVQTNGSYYGLEGVDPWDEQRDARLYAGPHPVVAHPPCSRWCRLAGFVEARWGHKRGEDDGCFKAALEAVRTYGGVLEHPAYSDAWAAFDLNRPPTGGHWVNADFEGGWTCYVEQYRYGHLAKKATWLYAHSVDLPELRWGYLPDGAAASSRSWCGNKIKRPGHRVGRTKLPSNPDEKARDSRPRLGQKEASATPEAFRHELVAMAQSAPRYASTS